MSHSDSSITIGESSGVRVELRTEWTEEETEHYRRTGETPLERLHRKNLAAMWAATGEQQA